MNWFVVGSTFDVLGKLLTAIAILLVHKHLIEAYNIKGANVGAIKKMKNAQILGELGIVFIIMGYLIHIFFVKI